MNRPIYSNPPKYHHQQQSKHHSNPHYISKRSPGWGYHTTWHNNWNWHNHPQNRWDHINYHHTTQDCSYHQKLKNILPKILSPPIQNLFGVKKDVKVVDDAKSDNNVWGAGPLTVPPPKGTEKSDTYDTNIAKDPKNDVVIVQNESLSPFHDSIFHQFGHDFRDIFNIYNLGNDSDDKIKNIYLDTKQTTETNGDSNKNLESTRIEKNNDDQIDMEFDVGDDHDQAMDIDVRGKIDIRRKREPITTNKK